ncbi:alpha/beta fold hydrolase [Aspergillus mulundensis]|uniref:AB hydrolase-1 domain-containing protein n=1 Tax=Aspergillus mulundensis TaxID=1810919 RepID=A0A3D8QN60_9EURO|nr:hypothetical protein DSM5745_10353 [Aspergillus mulundensis]RDW63242.1 hypothetical protein DSM5745_10353 [Aspergillus mulundensis]
MSAPLIVLPRPGETATAKPIPAPSEAAFIQTFGQLLPPASYLHTPNGRVAYYQLSPSANDAATSIRRVLFVHGVQTPAIGLQPLAKELSSRFPSAQCVLVDLWGHGLTDTPFAPHEPALFHKLLEALMAHLDWPDAHLIGYSFGGSTTATLAAARPGLVSSMVLVAPAGLLREAQFSETERMYLRGGNGLEEAAKDWILEFLEGGQLVVPSDWKERVARGEVVAEAVRDWELKEHRGHLASVVAVFRDGGALDRHADFARAAATGIPALGVLGETDEVCSVQDLHEVGFKNVAVIPQVGHGVARQRVSEVAQLIEGFWKDFVRDDKDRMVALATFVFVEWRGTERRGEAGALTDMFGVCVSLLECHIASIRWDYMHLVERLDGNVKLYSPGIVDDDVHGLQPPLIFGALNAEVRSAQGGLDELDCVRSAGI